MAFDMYHRRDISDQFMSSVEAAMLEEEASRERRKYLGASYIGHECERHVAFSYSTQSTPINDPRLLRTFALGHVIEDLCLVWFKKAYDIVEADDDGNQFGFSYVNDNFKGHSDGVIMGRKRSDALDLPAGSLWEHKGLFDAGWKELKAKGVRESYPKYWGQTQAYMHSIKPVIGGVEIDLSINPAVFSAFNKNTSEMYIELITPNRDAAVAFYKRAQRIINDPNPENYPKISENRSFLTCSMCHLADKCHGPKRFQPLSQSAPVKKPMWS